MSKRRQIEVKGEAKPVMGFSISNKYIPEKPPKAEMPPQPPKLKSTRAIKKWLGEAIGELEDTNRELFANWLQTRETDTRIRIEFLNWAWVGRSVAEGHVHSIDGARINCACELVLPDGRILYGHPEALQNDRICANGTVLREERESGVSYELKERVKEGVNETMGEHIEEIKAIVKLHTTPKDQLSRIQKIKKAYGRLRTWSKVAAEIIRIVDLEMKTGKPNPNENDWLEPDAYRRLSEDLKTNTPKSLVKQLADTLSKAVRRFDKKPKSGKST